MRTSGDKMLDAPLARVGGKGLFIKELEYSLLDGRADVAVHSMKDVPVELPPALHLPVIMARADPRDALVSTRFAAFQRCRRGPRSGLRACAARCQLAAHRPDLRIENLRGGVDTRLRRLDDGHFDAIVLAVSGLERGGHGTRVTEAFDVTTMLPAAGQGALGIECRRGDAGSKRSSRCWHALEAVRACLPSGPSTAAWREGARCRSRPMRHSKTDHEPARPRRQPRRRTGCCAPGCRAVRTTRNRSGVEAAATVLEQGAGEILAEIHAAAGG